jgi:hypothetical protein
MAAFQFRVLGHGFTELVYMDYSLHLGSRFKKFFQFFIIKFEYDYKYISHQII